MSRHNIIGIDLAKNIFHVCVMTRNGRVLRRKKLSRSKLYDWIIKNCEGIIALEACGGAHYWSRRFRAAGFKTRIVAAQFVKPFVKSNKNDEIDSEAICEAASRPQMRFVSTRSEEQQDIQNLHRIRERLVRHRTGLSNEIRGLLLEYGIVIPKGISHVHSKLPVILEEVRDKHSALWQETFRELYREFCSLDKRIAHYEKRIVEVSKSNEICKQLLAIPGVGPLTATAIVGAVGNAKDFKNARQFSAWLGLVPRQLSTGGKTKLGRISKRGDKYLRKLLVLGARSCAIAAQNKLNKAKEPDLTSKWLFQLAKRRGCNRAIVALANKIARRIWMVLSGREFKSPEQLLATTAA